MGVTRQTITGGFNTLNQRVDSNRSTCAGAWVPQTTFETFTGTESVKTVTSVDTPGFHRLLRCGRFLPLNPFEVSTVTTTRYPGSGTHQTNFSGGCYLSKTEGPYWTALTDAVTVPTPSEVLLEAAANAAIADVKASVFDALTYVGEIRETARLLATNWGRILWFAKAAATRTMALKKSRRKYRSVHKTFLKLWLEYRFGWVPLVNESLKAVQALERRMMRAGDLLKGSGLVTESLDNSGVDVVVDSTGTATTTTIITGSRKYHGMAYATLLNSSLGRFGADPLVTFYELIPFSFLVDRFIDFGTWIQAISPFSGANLQSSAVGVRDSYVIETIRDKIYSGAHDGSLTGIKTRVEVESYSRAPEGASLPGWNPRLTVTGVIDIVALALTGAFSIRRILSN